MRYNSFFKGTCTFSQRRAFLVFITFILYTIYSILYLSIPSRIPMYCGVEKINKSVLGNISHRNVSSIVKNISFPIDRTLCKQDGDSQEEVWLLISVLSSLNRPDRRDTIRKTWGSLASSYSSRRICLFFIVGTKNNTTHDVRNESRVYNDIIQINKEDKYNNLIYKSVGILKWTNTYVKGVKYILKIDDDVILNVQNLIHRLTLFTNQPKFIMGRIGRHFTPYRKPTDKYYTSKKDYPLKVFPNYIHGPSYVISGDLVSDLLEVIPRLPPIKMEDVLITGIASSYTSAVHIGTCGFMYPLEKPDGRLYLSQYSVTMHGFDAKAQMKLWEAGVTKGNRPIIYSEIFNL